jgi:hypothetical protein
LATIAYFEPQWVRNTIQSEPNQALYAPAPGAYWRQGSFLVADTTGTVTAPPAGSGSLAGVAGPLAANITFSTTTSAGAPGGTYWQIFTYTGSSAESLPSQEFIQNVLPGNVPSNTVSATGAPASATGWNMYTAFIPGFEALQNASATSLGSAYANANPLTNSAGYGQAATGTSTGIIGMAINDSNQQFYNGPGGSITVGNQSIMGATNTLPPLTPAEPQLDYVMKLQDAWIEINLRQTIPLYPTLLGASVGLYLDASTGWFVADTAQTACATIVQLASGVPSITGNYGDLGARVVIKFNGTALV